MTTFHTWSQGLFTVSQCECDIANNGYHWFLWSYSVTSGLHQRRQTQSLTVNRPLQYVLVQNNLNMLGRKGTHYFLGFRLKKQLLYHLSDVQHAGFSFLVISYLFSVICDITKSVVKVENPSVTEWLERVNPHPVICRLKKKERKPNKLKFDQNNVTWLLQLTVMTTVLVENLLLIVKLWHKYSQILKSYVTRPWLAAKMKCTFVIKYIELYFTRDYMLARNLIWSDLLLHYVSLNLKSLEIFACI